MVGKQFQVLWTKRSQQHLVEIFEYISQDSSKNAVKVVEDIAVAVKKASANPEIYNPDKYKINNDGSYRCFEKHRYPIVYRYSKNVIRVLRIRHTGMEPLHY